MSDFGICNLAVIPVRKEPSDMAEMTTQLLFGDLLEVIEHRKSWVLARNSWDGYEGWIDAKQYLPLEPAAYMNYTNSKVWVNREFPMRVIVGENHNMYLPGGCSFYRKEEGFFLEEERIRPESEFYPFEAGDKDKLAGTALSYISCPYLWGGKTFMGLDCSGFTQVVYKQHGVRLLRDATQQAGQGENISFISDSRPGDLAFFDHGDDRISHVGILLDQQTIIHCSGMVRIDRVDHHGIFHTERKQYTHNLRMVRRMQG